MLKTKGLSHVKPIRKIISSLCMIILSTGLVACNNEVLENSSTPAHTQIIPASTYLVMTFNWYDGNSVQIGDSLTQFKNSQLPYQFSKDDFVREEYGSTTFTGFVESIEHNIQYVSHLDEWQHDITIKMRDSTRRD